MTGYGAFEDPYCYAGSTVLKNKAGLRDPAQLDQFELVMSSLRAQEPLPHGRFGAAHYRAIHRHLFQDVYTWAGRYRTVRIAKGGNMFCFPEHIDAEMEKLFAGFAHAPFRPPARRAEFIAAATALLAELNAIHAFREGNGRTQLAFLHLIAQRAGRPVDLAKLRPEAFLQAMIASFGGKLTLLECELTHLLD